jgi:ketosteroid isomerase-like protein
MSTATVQTEAEAQIRRLIADREQAMRTGDADYLISGYAPDAIVFDLAPPLRHERDEVHDVEALRRWFAKFGGPIGFTVRDLVVTTGEDIAFCYSLNRMGSPDGSPEPFEMWFRSTVCLRRTGGDWLITHEHTSTPFYMDGSFLAATDLRP